MTLIADSRIDLPMLPPLTDWQDTCTTVHMWTQVAGKVRLVLSPDINHGWGSTLYVTTRGLTTSPIPYSDFTFAIDFDFIEQGEAQNTEFLQRAKAAATGSFGLTAGGQQVLDLPLTVR